MKNWKYGDVLVRVPGAKVNKNYNVMPIVIFHRYNMNTASELFYPVVPGTSLFFDHYYKIFEYVKVDSPITKLINK